MASKFQNRLVGTVILVAVGVIVLPGLLDGQKKHYKEEFAAIPLVPKPDDQQDSEMVPPVTQSLPAQPPEGAGSAVNSSSGNGKTNATAEQGRTQPDEESDPVVVSQPPVHQSVPAQTVTKPKAEEPRKPKVIEQPKQKLVEQQKPKAVEQPKPKLVEQPKAVEQPKQEAPKAAETTAPAGQAYVVQLGALKNASKVNEIVAQLRLSGYRAFTVPSTPVQGQITRIYVGPDASKTKMQGAVGELKNISGLGGVVKPYSAR
ncbi:cell division protein DedD [Pantoea sp. Bo_2]|uniref:Cell division protein DedD n=1 Tax=Candidatus Pantoea gossypiicola TaxID=2608008 RepID=A0AB34CP56_9GAMM|nr:MULTISPECIES: cell division protein DedD [Pantoea]KAA5933636.1 cell division protein DedD [Pantoea sp. VH_8]KAA5938297.1 cell division protein DedD [Pantoea sp. VH_4]KAA5949866.1 cell division protein DedD [Pantoea sp. VH_3]KAA5953963.1 cell division protein DedD [Pantoea sp. VH_25]KAA5960957.1 cell division protein DedD [Pantoea sp. VH_24]